jgi:hypothetical protein
MYGLSELSYPFYDRTMTVTRCICIGPAQDHAEYRVAGQNVGVKHVGGSRKPFGRASRELPVAALNNRCADGDVGSGHLACPCLHATPDNIALNPI